MKEVVGGRVERFAALSFDNRPDTAQIPYTGKPPPLPPPGEHLTPGRLLGVNA